MLMDTSRDHAVYSCPHHDYGHPTFVEATECVATNGWGVEHLCDVMVDLLTDPDTGVSPETIGPIMGGWRYLDITVPADPGPTGWSVAEIRDAIQWCWNVEPLVILDGEHAHVLAGVEATSNPGKVGG